MERLAVSDFTLSDGTLIPRGTSVGVISHGRHLDEDILENARVFDAFRYARLRAQPEHENQFTFAQSSSENMMFGLGRHACPGRHFASALIKLILVHLLVSYDIKFMEGKPLPESKWTQKFRNPDFAAGVAFHSRAAEERFAGILA
jgi:cytochrome P450